MLADLSYGSAGVTARAIALDEASEALIPKMLDDVLEAARDVARGEAGAQRPLLALVRELTQVADSENPVVLETAEDEVIFTAPAPQTVSAQPTTRKSLGTVRGRVETLSHRRGLRFTLYELATDRPISCYLEQDEEDLMRDAWGRIADVTGVVTRDDETGRPIAVRRVTSVGVVDEGDRMGFLAARGVVGGTEPAEQVIRRIRDAG